MSTMRQNSIPFIGNHCCWTQLC